MREIERIWFNREIIKRLRQTVTKEFLWERVE